MNRFQANLCLLTAVLCWSLEVAVYTFHLAWNRHNGTPPTLADPRDAARYVLVTLLATAVTLAVLVPSVRLAFPAANVAYFAQAVAINNTIFALVPGMALIVIMRTQYHVLPYRAVARSA